MNNVILTQLSENEMRRIIREELQATLSITGSSEQNSITNEFMTIEEVAKYINMAVSSVYGFVHFKRIPYIKRGKRLIFEKSKINEWLQNGRQKTKEEIEEEALSSMTYKPRRK